jgi:hypothetical protein
VRDEVQTAKSPVSSPRQKSALRPLDRRLEPATQSLFENLIGVESSSSSSSSSSSKCFGKHEDEDEDENDDEDDPRQSFGPRAATLEVRDLDDALAAANSFSLPW